MMTTALAQAIMCEPTNLQPCLEAPIKHGLIFKRQKDDHPRSPWWYCAIDRNSRPKMARVMIDVPVNTNPTGDQPRSERGREGMEPKACESADGRGTDGAPALATLPHYASPVGGPMGTGQPAAAGPISPMLTLTVTLPADRMVRVVQFIGQMA